MRRCKNNLLLVLNDPRINCRMKFFILMALIVAFSGNLVNAGDLRIASVDVRKIFNGWQRSVQAKEKIEKTRERLERENNERLAVINQYRMERSKMHQIFKAHSKTMSQEDRDKMDVKFRSLGRDALALEQDRRDFFRKNRRMMMSEVSSQAKLILDQITQLIRAYAEEKKIDMVVEMGGDTTRNVPLFLHLEGAEDITNEIIKRLNQMDEN